MRVDRIILDDIEPGLGFRWQQPGWVGTVIDAGIVLKGRVVVTEEELATLSRDEWAQVVAMVSDVPNLAARVGGTDFLDRDAVVVKSTRPCITSLGVESTP